MICKEFTIEEFYNWAIKNNVKDYKIAVQYRDDGGDYSGVDCNVSCDLSDINRNTKEVVL